MIHEIAIKRAYDPASPSTELREWVHADPAGRWNEFCRRDEAELISSSAFASLLKATAGKLKVTLLYSSHNRLHNNAVVVERAMALGAQNIHTAPLSPPSSPPIF